MTWTEREKKAEAQLLARLRELCDAGHGEILVKVSRASNRIIIRKSEDEEVRES